MQKQRFMITGVVALLAAFAAPAHAQREGLYFGGAVGLYDIKENALDEEDRFWKGIIGAQFNDWFGIEAAYVDFDRASNQNSSFEADGLSAAAVLSYPIGRSSTLYGKIGQYWWDAKSNFAGVRADTDGNDTLWGAGLKFGLSETVGLRIEYERYDVADIDLNTVSAGIQLTF